MFVTNDGAFAANPFTAADRYLQLAHQTLPDALLLNQFDASGNGYSLPTLQGLIQAKDRVATGSLVTTEANVKKLIWQDLAFVVSLAQLSLFEQLLAAQTSASPVSVVDRMLAAPVSKLVLVEPAPQYKTQYNAVIWLLIQFSLKET